jgi:C4-dicarboxylate-specific signal transduction histidine kinase
VRLSLRFQLLSSLILLPLAVAAVLTFVAIKLFQEDKELYVYDLSSQSVDLVARNLATTLESLRLQAELSQQSDKISPPFLALGHPADDQAPREKSVFFIENISGGDGPRLRIFSRGERGPLSMDLRPKDLLDLRGISGPSQLIVANEQGMILVHSDEEQITARRSLTELIQNLAVFSPSGSRVAMREVDWEGAPMLVAYARVGKHLVVFQTIAEKDVFAAAEPLIKSAVFASLAVVVVAILLALLLGRSISRPLLLMTKQAEAIGRGEFGIATETKASGEVARLVESLNAMSASLKRREQEIGEMQHRLLQSERHNTTARLISSIAKDVSTPLEACFSLANQTLQGLPRESKLRGLQEQILSETDRAANMLQNLSRVASREEEEAHPVELDMLVADVLISAGPLLEKQGVEVEREMGSNEATVRVSPDPLRNALLDLLFFVASEANARVKVSTWRRDQETGLAIEYEGTPLSEAERERLFKPFSSDVAAGKSSLVLAVTSMVIEEQGGRLAWESLPNGNRIDVIFPAG